MSQQPESQPETRRARPVVVRRGLESFLPILRWSRGYDRTRLLGDLFVALVVTVLLIPQSLAYALLAGVPAEVGLYASIVPLLLYAVFGTSCSLAVGPVAVISLMTAGAASAVARPGSPEYLGAVVSLALLSGLALLVMGLLRLGFLANFLSHPVISAFVTASAIQIAAGQLGPLLGVASSGHTLLELVRSLAGALSGAHLPTALVGLGSLVLLVTVRSALGPLLRRAGLSERLTSMAARLGPALAVVFSTALVALLGLADEGVAVVGTVPSGLPSFAWPRLEPALLRTLLGPALLLAVVGYVESISVALTLAAKRRRRVDPDQELIALGAANVGSALFGGMPVTGGFSRSVVNFDAGAETPAAGAFTAVGIAVATLTLTPLLHSLPKATLAATILVAVLSLVDLAALRRTLRFSRPDFAAMLATIVVTWGSGVELGLVAGVGLSLCLHLYATSRPHVAVLGQLPGTVHFRNVDRHEVVTDPRILSLRIDESLYFPNVRYLEELLNDAVAARPELRHVVLSCAAVNTIDASALEALETSRGRLAESEIALHLAELKGPVLDRLRRTELLAELAGRVHLTTFDAIVAIDAQLAEDALSGRATAAGRKA
jgi:SulP family sulfate permease